MSKLFAYEAIQNRLAKAQARNDGTWVYYVGIYGGCTTMKIITIDHKDLIELGLSEDVARTLTEEINHYLSNLTLEVAWQRISKKIHEYHLPYRIHLFLINALFPKWADEPELGPMWIPDSDFVKNSNLVQAMAKLKIHHFSEFHSWSTNHYEKFWDYVIKKLSIRFQSPPAKICDLTEGVETPHWLPEAKMNIVDSCFNAPPSATAIYFQSEQGILKIITYEELNHLSNRIANSLVLQGYKAGDAIAIIMPMTHLAVALYLGIIKMGGIVISIADSFSHVEIAMRLRIAKAKLIFSQDIIKRNNKTIPLYERIIQSDVTKIVVLSLDEGNSIELRKQDLNWNDFLVNNTLFTSYPCSPMDYCNILFSSGTTGEPKAIPWNHTTPIKAASDAYFHHNIQPGNVLAWPTNLGWMMGPWLIFASLINQASMALYEGLARDRRFGEFVQDVKVTMLGVVPTIVSYWHQTGCMEGLDWNSIITFSSTGECSNPEDMLYLMALGGYKPIIEYCGGTEIGGGYVTSTLIQKNYPCLFSTPALGLNFYLLNEEKQFSTKGEVAIVPPSIGLSTELINANHHQIYYANMPKAFDGSQLRRHGDQLSQLLNGYYTVLGRADDAINLGGIKISSVEIERVLVGTPDIIETAAIGAPSQNRGPDNLIIYACSKKTLDLETIKNEFQKRINGHLNPLFKIKEVIFIEELPKTASNKIMRRELRKQYKNI